MSKTFAWPDGELKTSLQLKEGHCTMLEFLAGDSIGFETKAVLVKPE